MTTKLFAVVLLALALAACDSSSTETNSNANTPAKTNTNVQSAPTPVATASAEPSTSINQQLKAGDKVKAVNGSFTDATVVSLDEKLGKVTIKLKGETKEKTVAIADVVKQ